MSKTIKLILLYFLVVNKLSHAVIENEEISPIKNESIIINSESLFEKIKKSSFFKGLLAGAIAQVTVEAIREALPERSDLYSKTGLCRDRLTEAAILSSGTGFYYLLDNQSISLKGLAGVLTGALGAALTRRMLGFDSHQFRKIIK